MARRHIIQTCTSSVASPKFNFDDEGVRRDLRLALLTLPPLFRLPKLPLLTASSSGVPGALSNCSRLDKFDNIFNGASHPVRLMLKRSFKSVKLVKSLSFSYSVLCFITSLVLECTTDNLPKHLNLCSPRLKILEPSAKKCNDNLSTHRHMRSFFK